MSRKPKWLHHLGELCIEIMEILKKTALLDVMKRKCSYEKCWNLYIYKLCIPNLEIYRVLERAILRIIVNVIAAIPLKVSCNWNSEGMKGMLLLCSFVSNLLRATIWTEKMRIMTNFISFFLWFKKGESKGLDHKNTKRYRYLLYHEQKHQDMFKPEDYLYS